MVDGEPTGSMTHNNKKKNTERQKKKNKNVHKEIEVNYCASRVSSQTGKKIQREMDIKQG